MKKKIIGLIGETGSGKDAFCDYVKKNHSNVFCFRFSQPLTEALSLFLGHVKKTDQQWLGVILRERFGDNILGKAIEKKIENIKKGLIILNGIRYWTEFKMIKKMGGKIIYITADPKIRWQRVSKRGEKKDDKASYEEFLKKHKALTEVEIESMSKKADFIIENNSTKKDLEEKIKSLLKYD